MPSKCAASQLDTIGEQTWSPWYDTNNNPLVRVINSTITVGENSSLRLEPGTLIQIQSGRRKWTYLAACRPVLRYLPQFTMTNMVGIQMEEQEVILSGEGISIHGRKPTQIEDSAIFYAATGIWLENAAPTLINTHMELERGCHECGYFI